jgi:hypothetical protein
MREAKFEREQARQLAERKTERAAAEARAPAKPVKSDA